ncbi:MAG: hypothetical protein M3Q19_02140 [Pseudomonadota bacterium]|nr:hypothetical protein [Pseudomonadota bacterium]
MSLLLFVAALAPPANSSPPRIITPRAEWRICTRQSAIEQLKIRPLSIESEAVVKRAFEECAEKMKAVSRTQSPDDIHDLLEEQRRLIRQDVEIFFIDNVTGHI